MIALGVLSFTKPTTYMTKLAQHASNSSVSLYYLSPEQISGEDTISGMRFCPAKQEWENAMFSIPPFIYDRCYYVSKKAQSNLNKVEKLKQRSDVQFLGYGLPNKWIVYQALSSSPTLQSFFPYTQKLSSTADFLAHLANHSIWLLKPIHGSQGRGLIKIEKRNGLYMIKEVKQPGEQLFTFTTTSHFLQWLHTRMKTTTFIFQPFLPLQNKEGYPFDLRLLIQKDENGNWKERVRVLRTGIKHHITSNLAGGGKMIPFSSLLQSLPLTYKRKIEEDIQTVIDTLPLELERAFQPLFELGIDLGWDAKQNLWILDINSKPGHKIVSMASKFVQKEIYEAPSKYSHYLATSLGNKMGVE
ncbi:YheC/YheD family endospore coat-associated protein [Sutcliffiella halmapala]|uniref:YheC/YheD family endospore coat-associated protein n=1 Tax=Sutcliffiella halmapala TaxID=79882 RepID=UPI00099521A3|nr:YheC/YheD family protein [Sutcliffiella halmapala]